MSSNLSNQVTSFNHVFGAFSEMQDGYSFSEAVDNADRALGLDGDHYAPVYSGVLGRLIKSSPWTSEQKSGMEGIRRRFNAGGLPSRGAKDELVGLGLSPSTASHVVLQWEDHMPGFVGEDFKGLGDERIVLRPNQGEQRRASQMRREEAQLSRREPRQAELFASYGLSYRSFIRSDRGLPGGKSAFGISSGDVLLHAYSKEVFEPEQFDQSKASYVGFWLTKPRRDVNGFDEFEEFVEMFAAPDVAKIKVAFDRPLIISVDVATEVSVRKAAEIISDGGVKGAKDFLNHSDSFAVGKSKGVKVNFNGESFLWGWLEYFFPIISEQFDSILCVEAGVPDLCIFKPDSRTRIVGWIKKDGEILDMEYGRGGGDDPGVKKPEKSRVKKPAKNHVKMEGYDDFIGGNAIAYLDYSGGDTFTYTYDWNDGVDVIAKDYPVQQWDKRYDKLRANGFVEVSSGFNSGRLSNSVKKRKSKYNGTLVGKFPEGLQRVPPVSASANHPSVRYLALCSMVAPERRWMVASALSGELDSRLYDIYREASGGDVGENIRETGDNGRVNLLVDSGSGISTEVDLGGSLETGYVVESINDPLGIFPEGTVQGDFLDFGTVEVVLKSLAGQGEEYVGSQAVRSSLDEWVGISFDTMLRHFMEGKVAAEDVIEKGRRSGWSVEDIDEYLWEHGRLPYGIEDYIEHPDWLTSDFDGSDSGEFDTEGGEEYEDDFDTDEYNEGFDGLVSSRQLLSSASPGDHVELRYKSSDGASNKFINMDYGGGPTFTATWGKFGSAGRQTEYPVSQWDSYFRSKRAKGYTDVTDGEEVVTRVRDVPSKKAPAERSVPGRGAVPSPVKQPNREPRQRDRKYVQPDLFASRRSGISNRFIIGR
jgi:hypothetical protein